MLSATRHRALAALRPLLSSSEGATAAIGRAGFASAADARPTSRDAGVTRARAAAQTSISDPEMLGNSMSDGFYASGATWRAGSGRRAPPSAALSSVSDPETFWTGSSMSDAMYEMPSALRARQRPMRPSHVSSQRAQRDAPALLRFKCIDSDPLVPLFFTPVPPQRGAPVTAADAARRLFPQPQAPRRHRRHPPQLLRPHRLLSRVWNCTILLPPIF